MKILHICLCGYYSEGWSYQDNLLAEQNLLDNHEVHVITSQYVRTTGNKIEKVQSHRYTDDMGINITRIPFEFEYLGNLKDKIRTYKNLFTSIETIKPEVIFIHGLQFYDLNIIAEYKKQYPDVKIYGDNHATKHNSGKNILSNLLLHRIFYKNIIQKNKWIFEKIFYITPDSKIFLERTYNLKKNLEFLPLCGREYNEEEIKILKEKIFKKEKLKNNNLLFIHSGKMDKDKKTIEVLTAFQSLKSNNAKLFLIGSFSDDIRREALELIKNSKNIDYLGWKSSDELEEYLCAADVLLQPGSQSIVFQQGISCGCAMILEENINTKFLIENNGILLRRIEDLNEVLNSFVEDRKIVEEYKYNSYKFSKSVLNYSVQSRKYLKD